LYVRLQKPCFYAGETVTGDVVLHVPQGHTAAFKSINIKVCGRMPPSAGARGRPGVRCTRFLGADGKCKCGQPAGDPTWTARRAARPPARRGAGRCSAASRARGAQCTPGDRPAAAAAAAALRGAADRRPPTPFAPA